MKENFKIYIESAFDCLIEINENSLVFNANINKCLFFDNELVCMKIFPTNKYNGIAFVCIIENEELKSPNSDVLFFKISNNEFVLKLAPFERGLGLSENVQFMEKLGKHDIKVQNFESFSKFVLSCDNKKFTYDDEVVYDEIKAVLFGESILIFAQNIESKKIIIHNGLNEKFLTFNAVSVNHENEKLELITDEKTLLKHGSHVRLLVENGNCTFENDEMIYLKNMPVLNFNENLLPLALWQCLKLDDIDGALILCSSRTISKKLLLQFASSINFEFEPYKHPSLKNAWIFKFLNNNNSVKDFNNLSSSIISNNSNKLYNENDSNNIYNSKNNNNIKVLSFDIVSKTIFSFKTIF